MRHFILCVLVVCFSAHAKSIKINIQEIPVTANPLNLTSSELVTPAHVVNGQALQALNASSLGETLKKVPGINNSAWGSHVGQPVIRGMSKNRIKILSNGMKVNDVSAVSSDHQVATDSISADQIEIIRGPASIIYGGGSIGGIINIIDHRIHDEFTDGIAGQYDLSQGGPGRETSNAFSADYGTKGMMLHFDGYKRDSKNLKIPGKSVSRKLAAAEGFARNKNGKDTLNSSYNDSHGGSLGISYVFDDGHTGFAFSNNRMGYGNPVEDGARFDLNSDRYDYVYEISDLTANVDKFKVKVGYGDYDHQEIEPDGAIGTEFMQKNAEGKFEFIHSFLSDSPGVIGVDLGTTRFTKDKGDALIANNHSKHASLYLLESFLVGEKKFTVGFRQGHTRYYSNDFVSDDGCTVAYSEGIACAASGGSEGATNFDDYVASYNTSNFSIGSLSQITSDWLLRFNLSHSQRAPSHNELFSYGTHHATETVEQGSRALDKERSTSIDAAFEWSHDDKNFSITPYFTRFNSYIALLNSGSTQHHIHEGEEESEALPVYSYKNIPAEFYGLELQGGFALADHYSINVWGDHVRAKNKDGGDLPRIPALRFGAGISGQWKNFSSNLDFTWVSDQTKIASYELKTDGYTDLSLDMKYRLPFKKTVSFFIKADNLLDEEKRDHASFIKDQVLSGGRSIHGGVSVNF